MNWVRTSFIAGGLGALVLGGSMIADSASKIHSRYSRISQVEDSTPALQKYWQLQATRDNKYYEVRKLASRANMNEKEYLQDMDDARAELSILTKAVENYEANHSTEISAARSKIRDIHSEYSAFLNFVKLLTGLGIGAGGSAATGIGLLSLRSSPIKGKKDLGTRLWGKSI